MNNENKKVTPPARRASKKPVAKKRVFAVLIAAILIVGAVAGSTLAWFTDYTAPVVNTFTVGDIKIDLKETTGDTYKMIPGHWVSKDPIVTVLADSEDCYLFVELTEDLGAWTDYSPAGSSDEKYAFGDLLIYAVADGWTPLEGYPGVYYRTFENRAEGEPTDAVLKMPENQQFPILKDNKVSVSHLVTEEMMDMLGSNADYPTLSVKAYAIQYYKTNDTHFGPVDAWKTVSGQS